MLVGCGIDLVEVARVRSELAADAQAFRKSLFTEAEIADCERHPHPARPYAARFAAKEACLKALGSGAQDASAWREVEVVSDAGGVPGIVLHGATADKALRLAARRIHVAFSATSTWATAAVAIER